jgi:hypothetical protein
MLDTLKRELQRLFHGFGAKGDYLPKLFFPRSLESVRSKSMPVCANVFGCVMRDSRPHTVAVRRGLSWRAGVVYSGATGGLLGSAAPRSRFGRRSHEKSTDHGSTDSHGSSLISCMSAD